MKRYWILTLALILGVATGCSGTTPKTSAVYLPSMPTNAGNGISIPHNLKGATSPTVLTGSVLPPGLTLDPNGVIHGTPTSPGIFVFTVTVKDAVGVTATTALTLKVYQVGDANQDFSVNVLDLIKIGQSFGQTGNPGWILQDVNHDGTVNVLDLIITGQHLGT
jgi:hypothetical protein